MTKIATQNALIILTLIFIAGMMKKKNIDTTNHGTNNSQSKNNNSNSNDNSKCNCNSKNNTESKNSDESVVYDNNEKISANKNWLNTMSYGSCILNNKQCKLLRLRNALNNDTLREWYNKIIDNIVFESKNTNNNRYRYRYRPLPR